jgi:hypothetical protein
MKNKLTIIFILVALIAVASLVFKFSSPFGKGGLRGIYKSEAAVSRQGLTLDLNFGNNNAAAAPTVYDTSGFNRHATSTAALAPTCGGKFCDFNGTQATANRFTGNGANIFNNNRSIAIKFSPDFAANDNLHHYFIDTLNARDIFRKGNDNTLFLYLNGTSISVSLATYQSYWKIGKENILIFSGISGNNNMWLNGIKILNGDSSAWSSAATTSLYFLGCDIGDNYGFDGKIHYLKVWNRLLTNDEVANLSADRTVYTQSAPQAASVSGTAKQLVGYWTMDTNDMSATGATMFDKSGQGNTGTVTGTTTSTGRIGQARSFNGTSNFIDVGNATNLNVGTGDVSLSAWVKPTNNTGSQWVLGKRDLGGLGTNNGYLFGLNSGQLRIVIENSDGDYVDYSAGSVSAGAWHQIIASITRNSATGVKIFIDGVQVGTSQNTTLVQNSLANAINLAIGRQGGSIASGYFNGSIDDVRIYNYALSAQDVANLYSAAKTKYVTSAPLLGLTLDLNFGNNNAAAAPTVYDTSGFNRHATSTAGATSPTCNNKFCDFDGGDKMTANATNVFNSSNISIAFKFSPDFAANDGNGHVLMDTTGDRTIIAKEILGAGHNNSLAIYLGSTILIEEIPLATYQPYWKVGQENVLIVISNAATDITNVWLNGNKILNNDTTAWAPTNPISVSLGSLNANTYYFDGKIHYLKVWNRLLTNDEVANLSANRTNYVK